MGLRGQMWQVIEWEDTSSDTLVYRFPHLGKEIMSGSKLTVRPSQVAVFVSQGQIADVFVPGYYKLETKNLPILSGLGSLLYQKRQTKFKAEVYFVNTKQFINQKWGTSQKIILKDEDFGVIRVGAFGTYSFRVQNAETFMKQLFGTNKLFTVDDINDQLRSMLVSTVADTIVESKVSALEIYANLGEFGEMCATKEMAKFEELGLEITNFVLESISFPESVEKAMDERASLGILSDKMGTYTQKKAADAIGDAARNTGTVGTFMGIGLGQQMSGTMGGVFGSTAQAEDKKEAKTKFCHNCGTKIPASAKFCPDCGTKFSPPKDICPDCGASINDTQKFCPDCGCKLK